MAELSAFLVRPLVVLLRDAQRGRGAGYSLNDVISGLNNNAQVGTRRRRCCCCSSLLHLAAAAGLAPPQLPPTLAAA